MSAAATPTSAPSEGGPPPRRRGHIPGEAGMWVFILGDMCVFALLFGVFMVTRGQHPHQFEHSQRELHRYFGAINTLILLTSSLAVVTAVRAMRAGSRKLASVLLVVAMVCGCLFLMDKALEWTSLISAHHRPDGNDFFTDFFVLTGIHALHVVIGLGVLIALFVLSRKERLTQHQRMFVEGGACFWHMVDLLWIVLFALLYLTH